MSLNDFELGKILGKGSFASVILVTRKKNRKIYALKRTNISEMDVEEREGALNEIRILASLSHPNIIGYKEAFFDENSKTLNIVMEYADDGDIDKKIKDNLQKGNMFSEKTLWSWIIQILKGLKYLHDNKIMHRDLKCANIFLMKTGLLKLGDLNVSKIAKLGITQTQIGTPYYISPEVLEEKPYNNKCDVWSVGCIIYEMCTLRPPFRGTSLTELYRNIKNGYYTPISNYYSKDMKDLISMMLVVDSHKRASVDDILNSNIVKKWITKIKNENSDIIETITNKDNNIKANLLKTIKIPKNIGEINKFLPKERYNRNNNIQENFYNNNHFYYNYNFNHFRRQIPKIGRFRYLNTYDNNMSLIQKDKEQEKNVYYNYNHYNNYNFNQKKNDICSYIKNQSNIYNRRNNLNIYNNNYNLYQNRRKSIIPNKYIYKQNYDFNKRFNHNEPYKNNQQQFQRKHYQNKNNNNNYIVKNNYEYQNNNNKKKLNRYKYLNIAENPLNEDEANVYNNTYNKIQYDNRYKYDKNNNYRNYNNDRRDIGSRYTLFNFRNNKDKYNNGFSLNKTQILFK
jgi:NIMA (never in mitosis gene a)-related kinase